MIINLIDKVKFAFRKDRDFASALNKILGFYPHKIELYRVALSHKSLAARNGKGRPANNERLEYLGDAVIEAVVSDIVFHRYPHKREGFLTSTRSKIVQRASLNHLASEMGLNRLIKATGLTNTHNNNIGGNAFEALVGAIYLDRGYGVCKWFIEKRIVGRLIDIDGVAKKEVNFKSKLLEWTQKNRIQCHYDFEEHDDDASNSPVFVSTIVIEGLTAGSGRGYSKKESQQAAAKDALVRLNRDPKFADSIYRSKEKRTAMEADEVCALPKVEDIEAVMPTPAAPARPASRHAKGAPRPRPAVDAKGDTAKGDAAKNAGQKAAEKTGEGKKNSNNKKGKTARPAADATPTAKAEVTPAPKTEAKADAKSAAPSERPAERPERAAEKKVRTEDKTERPVAAVARPAASAAPSDDKTARMAASAMLPPAPVDDTSSGESAAAAEEAEKAPRRRPNSRQRRRLVAEAAAEAEQAAEAAASAAESTADVSSEPAATAAAEDDAAQQVARKKRSRRRPPRERREGRDGEENVAAAPADTAAAAAPSAAEREAIIARAEASAFETTGEDTSSGTENEA
jgi:ribonuclease-3